MKDYSKRYPFGQLAIKLDIILSSIQSAQTYSVLVDYQNGLVKFIKYTDDATPQSAILRLYEVRRMSQSELIEFGRQL